VRAQRSTPRAQVRAKHFGRMLETKTSWKTLEGQITICQ
jgi:hypothetical protein